MVIHTFINFSIYFSSCLDTNISKLSSSIKKRSPTSSKKTHSKDRLEKILRIANSIKSRGGVLT